jgi:hypothetical protein
MIRQTLVPLLTALAFLPAPRLAAQAPADLAAERAAFTDWLVHSPVSPYAAVSAAPLDPAGVGLELGDRTARIVERNGAAWLEGAGAPRVLPRNRPALVGTTTVLVTGEPPRSRVMLFGAGRRAVAPAYYPYDPALVFSGTLVAPTAPGSERVLTPDGVEVEATAAGTVTVPLGGGTTLRVLRLPDPGSEESSLEIYFRDGTSGTGSYPAGRFVTLAPIAGGRYRLDFNRSRNPFCAYNAAYPCPAPWRGNTIAVPVAAGERYESHP